MTLTELAERAEKATGPDYAIDYDIALETGWQQLPMDWRMSRDWRGPNGAIKSSFPRYTASIDAAMSLVPEGCELRIERRESKGMRPAYASIWKPGAREIDFHANGHGATPALALVAAALRAREAK